jgi:enoyl-CoA hydratase/carnithine racemase
MYRFIKAEADGRIAIVTLERPEVLNAWHRPMRNELVAALTAFNADAGIRAMILTGAGRAFCAGQDLNEARTFDPDRVEEWIEEWRRLYGTIRDLDKPLVIALNGVAAGSAFQASLLADVRVGHPGVQMGQPEIDSGIPSITGFWIMREALGLSRTTELIVTGRMLDAPECHALGLVHYLVPEDQVMTKALEIAARLATKPPIAMRLDKQRFREVTQAGFDDAMEAAVRIHREAYASGEPAQMIERFFADRAARKPASIKRS